MSKTIFNEINDCETAEALFDLASDYFQGQGFGGICYVAPAGPAGPFVLMHRGMPVEFMALYRDAELHLHDPIPGLAFRLARPERLGQLVKKLPALTAGERRFMEVLERAGLAEALVIPCYGPFGRPALLALSSPADPALLDEFNTPLAEAVAQQIHTRMELLQARDPPPGLSPREREIVHWLGQGKSTADIATILGVRPPTVTTHIQRIYAKLQVHDRASLVAKALAHHYL